MEPSGGVRLLDPASIRLSAAGAARVASRVRIREAAAGRAHLYRAIWLSGLPQGAPPRVPARVVPVPRVATLLSQEWVAAALAATLLQLGTTVAEPGTIKTVLAVRPAAGLPLVMSLKPAVPAGAMLVPTVTARLVVRLLARMALRLRPPRGIFRIPRRVAGAGMSVVTLGMAVMGRRGTARAVQERVLRMAAMAVPAALVAVAGHT